MISKLKSRDIEYFINKTELEGLPKTIVFLANLPVDDTKYGRELIQTRDEVVKKLVYLERTVEEHENVSSHICEREIPNIYNEHMLFNINIDGNYRKIRRILEILVLI